MGSCFCVNCMRNIADGQPVCPHCGFDMRSYAPEPHQLPPGSLLNGRFLIGRVLGEGGFGITYVGKDTTLDLKVAIKEFYMSGYVNRNATTANTVQPNTGDYRELFEKNRDKFLNEAKTLAKFTNESGIVGVREFLKENNTAYIVMNFLSGETLRKRLDRIGKMPWRECVAILTPVMRSLQQVHQQGVIHRDISPDNIMLTERGEAKLLDFGAARDVSGEDGKSLSVILKRGYAPEEQYRRKGAQGPWTDIYAFCATLYRCITGVVPEEAMERLREDSVIPPSQMGCDCPAALSGVIMRGMSVFAEDRYQTVADLAVDMERAVREADVWQETELLETPRSKPKRVTNSNATVKPKPAPVPEPIPTPDPPLATVSGQDLENSGENKKVFLRRPPVLAAVATCVVLLIVVIFATSGNRKASGDTEGGGETILSQPVDIPKTAEKATGADDTASTSAAVAPVIEWEDPVIRDAVLDALDKETDDISETDLTQVVVLNVPSGNHISTLIDLRRLPALTELRLGGCDIADFSFPDEMGTLNVLNLSSTGCREISFLSLPKLWEISKLDLSGNQIADLTPLSNLETLTYLNISDNPVSSLDVLQGLDSLNHLDARGLDATDWTPVEHITTVEGAPAATGVKLSQNSISLIVGKSTKLTAAVLPDNAFRYSIEWSSSDTSVASVDANGYVAAKKAGNATITVTCSGGYSDSCEVKVSSDQTAATTTGGNSGKTGTANGSNSGKTGNTGSKTGGTGNSEKAETPAPAQVSSVSLSRSSILLDQGGTAKLSVSIAPTGATGTITWSSSNPSVAKVDGNGNVNAIGSGSAIITASCNGHSATCTVTVQ